MSGKTWISSELWQKLKPLAREKRHDPTLAEDALWQCLRMNRVCDLPFRRQHPIGPFIVDFYCAKLRLVIEVDGPIHRYTLTEDAVRQEYLECWGMRVIRFSNDEVLNHIEDVLARITEVVRENPHPPTPSP